uniref:V-type proton ATPase subunit F (Trinotate prediction) n=1 Tax=Henneguya salminicola TaxID=69463 RepID=A0A6G3MMV3_HENSL
MSASHLIGLIGDEDTCVGFLLAGIGDINKQRQKNFLIVTKDTIYSEIEDFFNKLITRNDIAIIMITQQIAERIRHLIAKHDKIIPTIVEIPSKEHPYEPSKDPILKRARTLLGKD